MGVLRNSIDIARPPAEVFEYCSDQCNELEWTPGPMKSCERLTDGPVGLGTRYRAEWSGAGSRIVEITRYEPPGPGSRRRTRARSAWCSIAASSRFPEGQG